MAAQYDPTQQTAKDRVRAMIADRAAPFRFQDEEIDAEISRQGSGDIAELKAAIRFVEQDQMKAGSTKIIKQGSVMRTDSVLTADGVDRLLGSLRTRLHVLLGQAAGDYGAPVVADGFANPNPWNGCGFLIR